MKRVTLCKVFVHDLDEALYFSSSKLGLRSGRRQQARRLPLAARPLTRQQRVLSQLDIPTNRAQEALVGRRAADAPLLHRDR
jgi:hypothetical protein